MPDGLDRPLYCFRPNGPMPDALKLPLTLVVITSATAEPVGRLDRDLWTIVSAGGEYQITELSVR